MHICQDEIIMFLNLAMGHFPHAIRDLWCRIRVAK